MKEKYDLIIAGGGPSGYVAAISASRLGVKTLLIEKNGFLGGMHTAALVGPIYTFHAGKLQIVRGITNEIIDELSKLGGTSGIVADPVGTASSLASIDTEKYKPLILNMAKKAGVDLLLHSIVGCRKERSEN